MLNQRRSQISPSLSTADPLRVKFTRIVSSHDEMKIAYQRLKSQIKIGLNEAEEVFASLSIPLMKLVGLKTVEMAEEGRFCGIIVETDLPQGRRRNGIVSEPPVSVGGDAPGNNFEVGNYASKATMAGRELVEKQQSQFIQLIKLLRQIEIQVNSRQNNMHHMLAKHRISLQKLFQQAINGLTNLHSQNGDTFFVSVKVLQALFDHMNFVFRSVEAGVDDLMQDLGEHMCDPMMEYVKGLNADMKLGTCARLLTIIHEMDRAMRNGILELEEAKKRIGVAEEGKIEALCKLKDIEERVRRMNEHLRLLPEARKGQRETRVRNKLLGMEEDHDKDDKLLWELLKRKRAYQTLESPMGPGELLRIEPKSKHYKPIRETSPLISYCQVARRCPSVELLGPQTQFKTIGISLGSSPSAAIQQAVSRRRINH